MHAKLRSPRLALVASTALLALGTIAAPARAYTPDVNYVLHCQGCHLEDGAATPGSVPALTGVGRFLRARGGREFLLRVPGVAQSSLDAAALAELLNWMLHRFSAGDLPADFTPYTADEVARGRTQPLTDLEGARRALLDSLGR
ncbi:MAG: hypothetical protein U0807_07890 [Candidatus Binatia bacterium]